MGASILRMCDYAKFFPGLPLSRERRIGLNMLMLIAAAPLAAQTFPSKPLRLVVAFPPGGTADFVARTLAQPLGAALGQNVVVENRAGGGTVIATEFVAKAPADGHTLLLTGFSFTANSALRSNLPFDVQKDFAAVARLESSPWMVAAHPSLPVKSVKELIALGKSKPGQIAFASSGNGTILHLAAETFASMAGIKMIHVPYKGSSQAVQALLAGEVAVTFSTMPPAVTNVKAGRLRALGVTTPKRNAAVPDVPAIAEAGLPGFDIVLYSGVLGPAKLPPAIVSKLNAEFAKAVAAADVKTVYAGLGVDAITDTPAEFAAHIAADVDKLGKSVRAAGAHAD